MKPDALPLSDIVVLDLTLARAGPTAVRQMADWGADVIRIEAPGRRGNRLDSVRHGPDFQNLHRDKRCITLDLKTEAGKAIFLDLARQADMVIENLRPDVKHRLGIDYETLREINPRIIYGSLSGFGQDGPYRERPGFDQIAQGMGGLMSITGLKGQGPVRVGIPISDLAGGMYLAMGMLVALHERERSGEGQWVQTSLLESMIAMLDFQAARWLIEGEVPPQAGNDHPTITPMGVFPTADDPINIASAGNAKFEALCREIGAEHLLDVPEYKEPASRTEHRERLNAKISEHTRRRPSAHWIDALNAAGVPTGPINTIDKTFADPQVIHSGIAQPVEHPELGEINLVGQPVHLTRTPTKVRRPSPEQGEHTEEVLKEKLGLSDERIKQLRANEVI